MDKLIKKLEKYLNVLHVCLNKADYDFKSFVDKIMPFRFLSKIPFIKKRLEKTGISNYEENYQNLRMNKKNGASVMYAGGYLVGIVGAFFILIILVLNIDLTLLMTIACIALSYIVCYIFVFRNDKYIPYFKKFEKWSKQESRKHNLFTLLLVILLFLFLYIAIIT